MRMLFMFKPESVLFLSRKAMAITIPCSEARVLEVTPPRNKPWTTWREVTPSLPSMERTPHHSAFQKI